MFPAACLVYGSATVREVRHSVALFAYPHFDFRGLVNANGAKLMGIPLRYGENERGLFAGCTAGECNRGGLFTELGEI